MFETECLYKVKTNKPLWFQYQTKIVSYTSHNFYFKALKNQGYNHHFEEKRKFVFVILQLKFQCNNMVLLLDTINNINGLSQEIKMIARSSQ